MKFGILVRNKLTGADLYIRILQITTLLPLLYMLGISVQPSLMTRESVFSVLFRLGFSALPRAEVWGLSFLYRQFSSEIVIYFSALLFALILGFAANKLLRENYNTARVSRIVFAALVAADLVLRLIPFSFNSAFGLTVLIFGYPIQLTSVFGFLVRLGCLILILLDLRADRLKRAAQRSAETNSAAP